MKKTILFLAISISLIIPQASGQESADIRGANEAWSDGKYIFALQSYLRILRSPDGDRFVETIAKQTGEVFYTDEITTDGRAPQLSPDGRLIAFEAGNPSNVVTRIFRMDAGHAQAGEVQGYGAAFSRTGRMMAYLRLPARDELKKASAALDSAPAQGVGRLIAMQALNYLQMKYAEIVLRDLLSGQETVLKTGDLLKSTLAFGIDDQTVYFAGARQGDATRNDIYAVNVAMNEPASVTDADGFKTSPQVGASGKALIFIVPRTNPFAPPRQPGAAGTAAGPQRGPQAAPSKFGIVDLTARKTTVIEGTAPAFSSDGGEIAWVARSGRENHLIAMSIGGEAAVLLKTDDRIDAPSFSPDANRLVYQRIVRDDWEIFLIDRDGRNESRLSREIQHDILPRFLTGDLVLGMIGEPRHRRSYIYNLKTNARTQLFHNNTVRTISPEYAWMASPDGSKVLIMADRDGDTVSTERGIYLVQLDRKVTKEQLISRLERNLAAETSLIREGERMFAPVASRVRSVVEQISTSRIYDYEKALFDFDSKHITRPGNAKAAEYLFNAYKSFGYEPAYQCFENRLALGGKTCNVVATLRGTENPELIYIVGSHFDSVPVGPGADDDTSGTAALLEAARALAGNPMPATIIFISYTGEESGLLGSREFVRQAQADKLKIVGVLNNDMIGWANDNRLDNTIRYSNDGIRDIQHAAASLFTKLITYDARYHRGTDATAFFEVYGSIIGGIGSYPVLGNPNYHQSTDLLETINHQLVAETSKTTAATLIYLASSPAPVKGLTLAEFDGKTARLTWAPSPEKNVREYIVNYGRQSVKTGSPQITVRGAQPGMIVRVKAIGSQGIEGWDWTSLTIPENFSAKTR
ncbi:MAG: M20/M25/M40 family metallo-hydrolase [Acidobacteria bacterium]|nr:M20/M25/M40 family metallo-hydrolase [Acidobacteriota bacterium]